MKNGWKRDAEYIQAKLNCPKSIANLLVGALSGDPELTVLYALTKLDINKLKFDPSLPVHAAGGSMTRAPLVWSYDGKQLTMGSLEELSQVRVVQRYRRAA